MLKHQISGLPVLEDGKLVGIITTSDVLHVFLETTGASAESSVRIDLLGGDKGGNLKDFCHRHFCHWGFFDSLNHAWQRTRHTAAHC
jgi:hypothetical protein